jgi:hypothetical protein
MRPAAADAGAGAGAGVCDAGAAAMAAAAASLDHTTTRRDLVWRFSLQGGFSPLQVSLLQGVTNTVSPQSMRYITQLQQLAVIDGADQGLVLIDVNTMAFAQCTNGQGQRCNPFF